MTFREDQAGGGLDEALDDPALEIDDEGQVVCVPCSVVLAPVASVGLAVARIREHLEG
ncbi:hypothetical protein [Gephyromycinifex aptenodytis]|uniref:hypothetical protein n=1 Tax=Gephyromycinifex aptenodytis TaxID=2716227 RepID=UPI001445E750|nr:hypothetical protein [Gephyromycinifex aptenodytis]